MFEPAQSSAADSSAVGELGLGKASQLAPGLEIFGEMSVCPTNRRRERLNRSRSAS